MRLGQGRWFRLNLPSVVFCVGWCILFIVLCTDCLYDELESVKEEDAGTVATGRRRGPAGNGGKKKPKAEPTADPTAHSTLIRYPMVLASSLSVTCYVAVAWRAPRPPQLHWHGFILMLMVLESYFQVRYACVDPDNYAEARWNTVVSHYLFGIKRITLVTLMILKIDALGPPLSRLVNIRLWGRILTFSQGVYHFFIQPFPPLWAISMLDRGFTKEDIHRSRMNLFTEEQSEVEMDAVDELVNAISVFGILAWGLWLMAVILTFVIIATRLISHTMQKLMDRKVDAEQLRKVRIVLWQHVAGFWLILITGCLSSAAHFWQAIRVHELLAWEDAIHPQPVAYLIDGIGDVVGCLLLSGILQLLLKDHKDGGDISGHIRGILHSAVLTSRGESVFEGRVSHTRENLCVVSFPGRYWAEWNELTWFCEQGELSSACVFLPQNDPHKRFGRHEMNVDTPDQCWCHSMYGAQKPWGCAWFTAWMANVEMAVRLNLELVVTFFPHETNQGILKWENLTSQTLWDGVGLGGSQKVEVAWLAMKGYRYTSEDINVTKQRFERCRSAQVTPDVTRTPPTSCTQVTPNVTGTPSTSSTQVTPDVTGTPSTSGTQVMTDVTGTPSTSSTQVTPDVTGTPSTSSTQVTPDVTGTPPTSSTRVTPDVTGTPPTSSTRVTPDVTGTAPTSSTQITPDVTGTAPTSSTQVTPYVTGTPPTSRTS